MSLSAVTTTAQRVRFLSSCAPPLVDFFLPVESPSCLRIRSKVEACLGSRPEVISSITRIESWCSIISNSMARSVKVKLLKSLSKRQKRTRANEVFLLPEGPMMVRMNCSRYPASSKSLRVYPRWAWIIKGNIIFSSLKDSSPAHQCMASRVV